MTKAGLHNALLYAARALGLFKLSRYLTRNQVRILCYHGIWLLDNEKNPFNFLFMSPSRFISRMESIKRNGYSVISLDEAIERIRENKPVRDCVVITIDDGWYGTFLHMLPALSRHQFPATLYLTTYHVEKQTPVTGVLLQYMLACSPNRKLVPLHNTVRVTFPVDLDAADQRAQLHAQLYAQIESIEETEKKTEALQNLCLELGLDWGLIQSTRAFHLVTPDEARKCRDYGVDLQLHTHRHRVEVNGINVIEQEIEENRDRLKCITPGTLKHFCYPSGEWNENHFFGLKRMNIISATTTDNGFFSGSCDFLSIPRILDGEQVSNIAFEAELSGLFELKRKLTKKIKSIFLNKKQRNDDKDTQAH